MTHDIVMDTNVPIVANGATPQASDDCVLSCIAVLEDIRKNCCLLIDDACLILDEYRRHLSPSGQPGPGDAFFKWLWVNQANASKCRQIAITLDSSRGFVEFPNDPALEGFHNDDRKFVAVSVASNSQPLIMNASDSDWWLYRTALKRCGIRVRFVCPDLMKDV